MLKTLLLNNTLSTKDTVISPFGTYGKDVLPTSRLDDVLTNMPGNDSLNLGSLLKQDEEGLLSEGADAKPVGWGYSNDKQSLTAY